MNDRALLRILQGPVREKKWQVSLAKPGDSYDEIIAPEKDASAAH